jgi:hypothetical protein
VTVLALPLDGDRLVVGHRRLQGELTDTLILFVAPAGAR